MTGLFCSYGSPGCHPMNFAQLFVVCQVEALLKEALASLGIRNRGVRKSTTGLSLKKLPLGVKSGNFYELILNAPVADAS
jgi:hypothetical protein